MELIAQITWYKTDVIYSKKVWFVKKNHAAEIQSGCRDRKGFQRECKKLLNWLPEYWIY